MNSDTWRSRLVASVAQAYRQCWGRDPLQPDYDSREILQVIVDDTLTESDMGLIAKADLILPLATAGLLVEPEGVSELPGPAQIRRQVLERKLHIRSMSIGSQLARAAPSDNFPLREEAAREWSTWITYCMHAHSPELRATLAHLSRAVEAISAYQERPLQVIERLGPDGERLVSLVPTGRGDDDWIEPLLDHCEVVAAHADSFRSVEGLFPELFRLVDQYRVYPQNDFQPPSPFHPYLWPFSIESFRYVLEIAEGVRKLARHVNGYDAEEATQLGVSSYVRERRDPMVPP